MKIKRFIAFAICLCAVLCMFCSCGQNANYDKISFVKWINSSSGMLSSKTINVENNKEFKAAFDEILNSDVKFGGLEIDSTIIINVKFAEGSDAEDAVSSLNVEDYDSLSLKESLGNTAVIHATDRKSAMKAIKAWSMLESVEKISIRHNLVGNIS